MTDLEDTWKLYKWLPDTVVALRKHHVKMCIVHARMALKRNDLLSAHVMIKLGNDTIQELEYIQKRRN